MPLRRGLSRWVVGIKYKRAWSLCVVIPNNSWNGIRHIFTVTRILLDNMLYFNKNNMLLCFNWRISTFYLQINLAIINLPLIYCKLKIQLHNKFTCFYKFLNVTTCKETLTKIIVFVSQ
jgi:hypothetical protein